MAEQQCANCRWFGKLSYGGAHLCRAAKYVKPHKHWPASVTLQKAFVKPTDGAQCPIYETVN